MKANIGRIPRTRRRFGALLPIPLLAMLAGCEESPDPGYWTLVAEGNANTLQGEYQGVTPHGVLVGGTGTANFANGNLTNIGATVYVGVTWPGDIPATAKGEVNYVYPDNVTVNGTSDEVY